MHSELSDLELTLLSYTSMLLLSDKPLEAKKRRLEGIRRHLKSPASRRMFDSDVCGFNLLVCAKEHGMV